MLAAGLIALALSGPIAYSNTAGDLIRANANASNETTLFAADGATALQALVISPDSKNVLALAAGAEPGLVLVPTTGGPPKPIGSTANADAGWISWSPDGKSLLYAGDYPTSGLFTVEVAGGNPVQLTSDTDYWPSFSADGGTVLFVRDSSSDNSDFNSASPADPRDDDSFELWSAATDGSGAAVIAEGDYETLALAQPASPTA